MTTTSPDLVSSGPPSGRLGFGVRRPTSTVERVRAVMAHHFLVYRRTWRGSIIGRFLSPLFFLLSMGLGLGALVDSSAGGVDGVKRAVRLADELRVG